MHRFARQAYDMGIRYIGGCCMTQSYHIRAVAEELRNERGKLPASHEKHELWGGALRTHFLPWVRTRASEKYWSELVPACGRPYSSAFSKPTTGDGTVRDKADRADTQTHGNGDGTV